MDLFALDFCLKNGTKKVSKLTNPLIMISVDGVTYLHILGREAKLTEFISHYITSCNVVIKESITHPRHSAWRTLSAISVTLNSIKNSGFFQQ